MTRVVVWGTGNVGRPAIRAVAAHADLELVGAIVADPAKVGIDVGTLAGIAPLGLAATDDSGLATSGDVDCVVYAVNADFRPNESLDEAEAMLRAGTNVVTTAFYPMYHPPSMPPPMAERFDAACDAGGAAIFASGIDPGWTCDVLPLFLTGVSADITEIRSQEIFNYALYDQPEAVRTLIGFGGPMDVTPPMLLDFSLDMVWGPVVRVLADGLGVDVDEVRTHVEKRALEQTVIVEGMGEFEIGTMGAFRFEVQGIVAGEPLIVMEHITRIHDDCAPDWPHPDDGQGSHRVQVTGRPNLTVAVHGTESGEPGAAGGGNATAANRIVNAIPAVCEADPGVLHPLDLPPLPARGQIRR
ncbi:MAG: dihydrodipicolinate reductase [Actinomycetota bacterium]